MFTSWVPSTYEFLVLEVGYAPREIMKTCLEKSEAGTSELANVLAFNVAYYLVGQ